MDSREDGPDATSFVRQFVGRSSERRETLQSVHDPREAAKVSRKSEPGGKLLRDRDEVERAETKSVRAARGPTSARH